MCGVSSRCRDSVAILAQGYPFLDLVGDLFPGACHRTQHMPRRKISVVPHMCDHDVPLAVKVGSDFSGMEMGIVALRKLGIPYHHCFSTDNNSRCASLIQTCFRPDVLYEGIENRDPGSMAYVDVMLSSPPCQPFSSAGKSRGVCDPRGNLVKHSLRYVKRKRPRVFIMENVKRLLSQKHQGVWLKIKSALTSMKYRVHARVLNTRKHGVPQNRERLYVVAIRCDSLYRPFKWPGVVALKYTAAELPIIMPDDIAKRLPATSDVRARSMVCRAYRKCLAAKTSPSKHFVAVDVGCSDRFARYKVGLHPCLTASRAQQFGWWWSLVGRRATLPELCRCQGCDLDDFSGWCEQGITEAAMAHMVGNAMSLNVIERVLIRACWSAGLVRTKPFDRWAS